MTFLRKTYFTRRRSFFVFFIWEKPIKSMLNMSIFSDDEQNVNYFFLKQSKSLDDYGPLSKPEVKF